MNLSHDPLLKAKITVWQMSVYETHRHHIIDMNEYIQHNDYRLDGGLRVGQCLAQTDLFPNISQVLTLSAE